MSGNIEKWEKVKLEEISQIIAGQSPNSDSYNYEKIGLPFFQGKADFGSVSPTAKVWCSKPIKIAEKDDILLSVRAPVGPTNIANEKCCIGRGLCAIRVTDIITRKFIYSYFKYFEKNITKMGSGSTFTAITTEDVKNLIIFLPPLDEQKRIVKIIETKLTAVEKAKKASDEQLSVINKLFNSYVDNIYKNENWDKVKLGDIGNVSMCKRIFKEQTQPKGDVPFYKISTFGKEADAYISNSIFSEYKEKYPFPKKGDVLISAAGTIGKTVIYDGEQAYFQDSNIVWIDNDEKKVLNKYLFYYYLIQPWNPTSGSIVTRLYNDDILKTDIPIPSINEQKNIVNFLEIKFNVVEKVDNIINEQSSYINALPSAILRKAFNGDY